MNRRGFLKSIGLGAAVTAVPAIANPAPMGQPYGTSIPITIDTWPALIRVGPAKSVAYDYTLEDYARSIRFSMAEIDGSASAIDLVCGSD